MASAHLSTATETDRLLLRLHVSASYDGIRPCFDTFEEQIAGLRRRSQPRVAETAPLTEPALRSLSSSLNGSRNGRGRALTDPAQ